MRDANHPAIKLTLGRPIRETTALADPLAFGLQLRLLDRFGDNGSSLS
jgi:hypothetical protein